MMLSFSCFVGLSALVLIAPVYSLPKPGPTFSLPLARRFNATGVRNILAHDRARVRSLYGRVVGSQAHAETKRYTVENLDEKNPYQFLTYVNLGPAPGLITYLWIDTAESNTWVGAFRNIPGNDLGTPTGRIQSITYSNGSYFIGSEYKGRVGFDQTLVIDNYTIASAERTEGFDGYGWMDGLLGLGPESSSLGTVLDNATATIPNLVDALYHSSKLSSGVFSIFMPPHVSDPWNFAQGQLILGGINYGLTAGPMSMVPLTKTTPSNLFWGFDQSVTYGSGNVPIMNTTAGVLDSLTSLTLLPSDAFSLYTAQVGAVFDKNIQLWSVTPAQYANLQSLYFKVASGEVFEFIPNAQILPRSLNTDMGGSADLIYLIIGDIGYSSGQYGLDFVNGASFLQRFYTSYDSEGKVVGIAPTSYTNATTN